MHGIRCGLLLLMYRGMWISLLDTTVNTAKMAEPIKVPFGMWTRLGPNNHVFDGDPDLPGKEKFLKASVASSYHNHTAANCSTGTYLQALLHGVRIAVMPLGVKQHAIHTAKSSCTACFFSDSTSPLVNAVTVAAL